MRSSSQEKKVIYAMFTEWRCDIRYKMALLSFYCVECSGWRPEVEWKSVVCMQSKFQ